MNCQSVLWRSGFTVSALALKSPTMNAPLILERGGWRPRLLRADRRLHDKTRTEFALCVERL